MTKAIPQVKHFMTPNPMSIEKDHSLYEAAQLMQKENFRHLPVTYQGKVEGILSMTDVILVSGMKGVDIAKMKVYEAYTPNPLTLHPETPIDQVAREMAVHKYGCIVIEDNGHLVGLFTWIDALKAMDELLHTRLK